MFGKLPKERKSNFYPSGQYSPAAALKSLLPAVRAMDTFILVAGRGLSRLERKAFPGVKEIPPLLAAWMRLNDRHVFKVRSGWKSVLPEVGNGGNIPPL